MPVIRALVVDDSRLAQFALKQSLIDLGVTADAVSSGEEALAYLSGNIPDVIFMDHTMPGMDGLQAVQEIKKDQSTAHIPVYMYTSMEGSEYENDAKAIGAVGVLPKQIKSKELTHILRDITINKRKRENSNVTQLRPQPSVATSSPAAPDPQPQPTPTAKPKQPTQKTESSNKVAQPDTASSEAVGDATNQKQAPQYAPVQSSVDEYTQSVEVKAEHMALRSMLRSEVNELSDFVHSQISQIKSSVRDETVTNSRAQKSIDTRMPPQSNWLPWSVATVCVVALMILLYHNQFGQQSSPQPERQNIVQAAVAEPAPAPATTTIAAAEPRALDLSSFEASSEETQLFITDQWARALEWALNDNNQVPYGSFLLGDDLVVKLARLVEFLENVEFKGIVLLEPHLGDFCVMENNQDEVVLPPAAESFDNCDVPELASTEAEALAEQQSLAFGSFMSTYKNSGSDNFEIQVLSAGNSQPDMAYPDPDLVNSAGDWNRIAAYNNRVEIQLLLK
jgi:CheY-like chemotaxis protein